MDHKDERQTLLNRMTANYDSVDEVRAVQRDAIAWLKNHIDDEEIFNLHGELVLLALEIELRKRLKQYPRSPQWVRLEFPEHESKRENQ